jgi:transcription elongation factor GreA
MDLDLITVDEKDRLEAKLAELRGNRSKLSERIAEARELGDLKENAEYHAAREQQGYEEAEISRLEKRLDSAQVIDESSPQAEGVVFLGSMVKLREVDNDDEDLYRLVGEATGDPLLDYVEVTTTSPMGEALMKANVGETISVRAPRGVKRFLIVEIC